MMPSFIDDEISQVDRKFKGNTYLNIIKSINNQFDYTAVDTILKTVPKFPTAPLNLSNIDDILINITKSVVCKMYQHDVGAYTLRGLLEDGKASTTIHIDAANNIAYAVLSSASSYVLGSLFYYYRKSAIFYYIRDNIVELNYRTFLEEIDGVYGAATLEDKKLNITNNFSSAVDKYIVDVLIRHEVSDDEKYEITKELIDASKDIDQDSANWILNNKLYPIPDYLYTSVADKVSVSSNDLDILKKLTTTFSEMGLKTLFREKATRSTKSPDFDDKVRKLYNERVKYANIKVLIDGFTFKENRTISNIVQLKELDDNDKRIISTNDKIRRILGIVNKYPKNCSFSIDEANIKVYNNMTGATDTIGYQNATASIDAESPFSMFGSNHHSAYNDYLASADSFCTNQAILSKQDAQNFMFSPHLMPKTVAQKKRYNEQRLNKILSFTRKSNKKLYDKILAIKDNINIRKLTHIDKTWSKNQTIDDNITAAYAIAEAIAFNNSADNFISKQQQNKKEMM